MRLIFHFQYPHSLHSHSWMVLKVPHLSDENQQILFCFLFSFRDSWSYICQNHFFVLYNFLDLILTEQRNLLKICLVLKMKELTHFSTHPGLISQKQRNNTLDLAYIKGFKGMFFWVKKISSPDYSLQLIDFLKGFSNLNGSII